jgi:hypothetical protein
MSTSDVFVRQAKSNILDWKHELIELEAKLGQGVQSPEQRQVSEQRIIELRSHIATAEQQIEVHQHKT